MRRHVRANRRTAHGKAPLHRKSGYSRRFSRVIYHLIVAKLSSCDRIRIERNVHMIRPIRKGDMNHAYRNQQKNVCGCVCRGVCIGAFNVNNMEIIQGITEAAKELKSPLILQVSSGARKYANHTYLMKLIEAACIETDLPICVHLDHGDTFELCKSCIDGGFSSVMIDGSHHGYEENVKLTRQVVEYAHDHGVVVEGELGRLEGVEDDVKVAAGEGSYTDPEQVQDFVTRTGVDSLAIAIGTSHGAFKFKPGVQAAAQI